MERASDDLAEKPPEAVGPGAARLFFGPDAELVDVEVGPGGPAAIDIDIDAVRRSDLLLLDSVHAEDVSRLIETYLLAIDNERPESVDIRISDGPAWRWFSVRMAAAPDGSAILDARPTDPPTDEAERHDLLNRVPVPLAVIATGGRPMWTNRAAENLAAKGLPLDRKWLDRIEPREATALLDAIEAAVDSADVTRLVSLPLPTGVTLEVEISSLRRGSATAVFNDVTLALADRRRDVAESVVQAALERYSAQLTVLVGADLVVRAVRGNLPTVIPDPASAVGRTWMSAAGARLTGPSRLADGTPFEQHGTPMARAVATGESQPPQRLLLHLVEGEAVFVEYWVSVVEAQDEPLYVLGLTDVTAEIEAEKRADEYAILTSDLVATIRPDLSVEHLSVTHDDLRWLDGIESLAEIELSDRTSPDEVRQMIELAPELPSHATRVTHVVAPDGGHRSLSLRFGKTSDGRLRVSATDVTALEVTRNRLRQLSERDPLTALANRRDLFRRGPALIGAAGATVVCLDIDHFKAVNDSRGHAIGDAVLRALAARLRKVCRPDDLLARLGGDEFVVVAGGEAGMVDATEFAERIHEATSGWYTAEGTHISVSTSVGAVQAGPGTTFTDALEAADSALYRVKSNGRAGVRIATMLSGSGDVDPPTVFVVDDDDHILRTLSHLLAGGDDRHVVTATSVLEAIDRWTIDDPDVVVLDLRLADGSGLEVLSEIRSHRTDTPIIIFTAHADAGVHTVAADDDELHIVSKSSIEELVTLVERFSRPDASTPS